MATNCSTSVKKRKDSVDSELVFSSIHHEKHANVPDCRFTWLDVFIVLVSMGTYVADIITDILVMLVYWKIDQQSWAALTLTFLILPAIVMQVFSTRWYMTDGHPLTFPMILIHFIMMGPIKRYVDVLRHGFQARRTKRIEDYQLMYSELSDVSMLRLFECFLEAAPQLVLQLYIMIQVEEGDHILTGISACFSLVSLSWAIVAYTKALRAAVSKGKRVSWSGMALQTVWRVGMVLGRITAIVLFATVYKEWTLLLIGLHWLVMTVWVALQDTDFCNTWWEERLFNAVVGVIYVFCFFNMKEGKSRRRATFYYVIVLIENSVMILMWWPYRADGVWYNVPSLFAVWGGFLIGITCMILYYKYFHPSSSTKCHCCTQRHRTGYLCRVLLCCLPAHDTTAVNSTPYQKTRDETDSTLSSDEELDYRDFTDLRCSYETPTTFCRDVDSSKRVTNPEPNVPGLLCNKHKFNPHHRHLFTDSSKPSRQCGVAIAVVGNSSSRYHVQSFQPSHNGRATRGIGMPRPRATSTPGDDLNVKSKRDGDHVGFAQSPSPVLEKNDRDRNEKPYDVCEDTPRTKLAKMCETPNTHKPGSPNTLVKKWVQQNQEMYARGKGGFSESFREECMNDDLNVDVKLRNKDERRHAADRRAGHVRNHPIRMKSFSKKDRLKVSEGSARNRRRKSSFRDSFREAFGFHVIDVDQVPARTARGNFSAAGTVFNSWKESGLLGQECFAVDEVVPRREEKGSKRSKNVNAIKRRVDAPPPADDVVAAQAVPCEVGIDEYQAGHQPYHVDTSSNGSKHAKKIEPVDNVHQQKMTSLCDDAKVSNGDKTQESAAPASAQEPSRYDNVSSDGRENQDPSAIGNEGSQQRRAKELSSEGRSLDRVEIMKMYGKSAQLDKASLARKQLHFKQSGNVASQPLSESCGKTGLLGTGVEALGKSMEDVLEDGDNYRICIRSGDQPVFTPKIIDRPPRRTLGAIENKSFKR